MRKYHFIYFLILLSTLVAKAQEPKKMRDIAPMDASSVLARKISVQYTEGLKAFYNSNFSAAIAIFNSIILNDPKHDASYFMLSRIYTEQQQKHDAVDALRKAIKIDKENIWYKIDLADLLMQMEEYAEAAKLWEQICKEKNNNEYYLYSLSQAYLNMKKLEKVVDTYNRMEKIIGYNDDITHAKVSIWLYLNNVKSAVAEYDKLIKMFPHNADYYVRAGDICQSNGMTEQAMQYYMQAQSLNSNDPQLNFTMAKYWAQQGDFDKEEQSLLKVFANTSVTMQEKASYLGTIIGKALREKNSRLINMADLLSDTLIATHPAEVEAYAFKATTSTIQKKYDTATTYFEKAISIDPSAYSLWDDYCYVLNQTGTWHRLVKYAEVLQELFPQDARMLCNLGLAFLNKGDADKAISYLTLAKSYAYEKDQLNVIYDALAEACKLMGDNAAEAQWRSKIKK